ncbi:MAG: CidA/LrgA family protein [Anaerococcus sp.]|nr:CidA/LrgA family protein [Anaerococcus sp.]
MKYLKEFTILCACLFLGVITRHLIDFPMPEAVYGMIYLFLALHFKILKPSDIKQTSDGLLNNLAFLFVPAGVGIMANFDLISGKIIRLIIITSIGTGLTMAITGLIVQALQRRK